MAITIDGSANTIANIAAGGLNDNIIDNGTMADNAIDSAEIAAGAVDIAHLSASGVGDAKFLRGDNTWQTIASAANTPAFQVYKGGDEAGAVDQSIAHSVHTKVTWPFEHLDTDNCFASDKFTPTSAGWYFFTVSLLMDYGEAEDEYATIFLHKNGTSIFEARHIEGVGTLSQALHFSFMAQANGSGDYFEIYVNQFSGDATNIDKHEKSTWWNGFKLIGLS